MGGCPSCGRENADDARFCSACGTALARTYWPLVRAGIPLVHAETLLRAGDTAVASRAARVGIAFLEEKGHVAGAARARERLDELRIELM
jgi:zinc-ribbon domain